jgi:hypothetical protein
VGKKRSERQKKTRRKDMTINQRLKEEEREISADF